MSFWCLTIIRTCRCPCLGISCPAAVGFRLLGYKYASETGLSGRAASMEAEADRERVVGINEEELKTPGCISRHLKNSELPLYISLDKDILTRSCAITNWDQGEAAGGRVGLHKGEAASCRSIIGVDVCGENPMTRNRREIGSPKRIRIRIGRLFVNYWKYAMYCVHDSRKNFEGIRLQE